MTSQRWFHWAERIVGATFAVALVVCALIVGDVDSASARKRTSPKLVQEFAVTGSIPFVNGGQPQSLPSTISVSGFEKEVVDVDVMLHGLNFSQANNVNLDVLLVGPGGQTALVLSDVGTKASNVTITLDDQAANQVAQNSPLQSGTFQPKNVGTVTDGFFPPAPTDPSSNAQLSAFNNTDPNGTWTLYVRHDPGGLGGVPPGTLSSGWSLRITSANGVPEAAPDSYSAKAGKTLREESGVLANDSDPDLDPLTAILASEPTRGRVQLAPDGSFTYRPGKKSKGIDSFTYLAQDPGGRNDLETVTIKVKKAKKKKGKK